MRSTKQTIQVFEWEDLCIGKSYNGNVFKADYFNALVKWQDKQGQTFFSVGYNKIKFSQWVGVIQVGGLVIEVLPKAGKADTNREEEVSRWKSVLIQMLRRAGYLKLRTSEDTALSTQRQSLFDLYYQNFLEEVETLLHRGLVKKYRRDERNRTALKGKLNFQKQVSKNLVHKERFYSEASEYDRQNPWNEILLAALRVTAKQTKSGSLTSKARNLELSFPDWSERRFKADDFDRLHYDRKTEGYEKAITLAKLILLQLNPQIHSGEEKVLAIFFDMNALWENWLLAVYRHTYRNDPLVKVPGKKCKTFWDTGQYTKVIESDILIEKIKPDGQKEAIVLDAKWKCPTGNKPADADLKQMFVYNLMWESQQAWLVYPQVNSVSGIRGYYAKHTKAGTMGMSFVNIFAEETAQLIRKLRLPALEETLEKVP